MKATIAIAAAVVAFIWYKQSKQQSVPVPAYLGNDGGVNYQGATVTVVGSLGVGPTVTTAYVPDSL